MSDDSTTLEEARAAKREAMQIFKRLGDVSGVGLTRRAGVYAVKVLLSHPLKDPKAGPADINGVPVVVQVVGEVRKQPRRGVHLRNGT